MGIALRTAPSLSGTTRSRGQASGLGWATAAGLILGLALAGTSRAETQTPPPVQQITAWVLETADNRALPFLIVDKVAARVFAFSPEGQLLGTAPVLLGLASGDISPPGIGDRPLYAISPAERITPAGRYEASLGENLGGKGILWIDYASSLSLHPVVTTRAVERRLQRLQSDTAADNRISYGCVNVPDAFFRDVVQPTFSGTVGIVYILPDTRSLTEVFFGAGLRPADPAPVSSLED